MHRVVPLVLLLALVAGCGGASPVADERPSARPSIPLVTDMAGEVVVADLDAVRYDGAGSACVATRPYADVGAGALVEIRSDTGVIKAVTALQPGELRKSGTPGRPPGCVFAFSYSQAAAGRPSFRVRVARRPAVTVSYRDLLRIEVVLGGSS